MSSGFALAASAAQAADVGWCGTPAEMTATLKAESQRSLAHGNQHIAAEELPNGELRAVNKEVGLFFSADLDGRVGYVIQADRPAGTPATKMCIADRMYDVRLYDARQPGIPPGAIVHSTTEAAIRRCEALDRVDVVAKESCRFYNTVLERSNAVGERVLLQGKGVNRQQDGSYRPDGTLITVTLIVAGNGTDPNGARSPERDGRGAVQLTALPEGATIIARVFTKGAYTETALQLLDSRKNGDQVSTLVQPR